MTKLFLISIAVFAAGCQTVSDVIPADKDTYFISSSDSSGFVDLATVKAMSLNKATAYCANQKKDMVIVSDQNSGIQGLTRITADFRFKCVDR